VQTPDGSEVMLGDIVTFTEKQGVDKIRREKGYRSALVIADVADDADINAIYNQIYSDIFPTIKANYPSVTTDISADIAEQQQQKDQMLLFGIIGIMLVYILLSIPLQSYTQPLIIMLVIPFSLLGGVWGHWLLGHELSLFSQFGMIAAAGVVINASLVLISAINTAIKEGMSVDEAIIFGANSRLRAIMLTSVTTFVGLLPIMAETSVQGRYVAPMAISIAFSLLVSTIVTLTLIPLFFQLHHTITQKMAQKLTFGASHENVQREAKG
jgi:multidrug efflux pump subunit AcrB